jgi:hypothetical protein
MSLTSIGGTAAFNSTSSNNSAGARPAALTAASDANAVGGPSIVTLSNGQTSTVTEASGTLSSTPLAAAWAPQLFAQADTNQDGALTTSELAAQLKRVGVSADEAQKLFDSFDTSKNGSVSIDEYVKGVTADLARGSSLFNKVTDSYIAGQDGKTNESALQSFLSSGLEDAQKYWSLRR